MWDLHTDRPQRDRFLWGHPLGQYFPSTIQFFPHFLYLMKGGKEQCPCVLCEKLAKRNQRIKGYFRYSPQVLSELTVSSRWPARKRSRETNQVTQYSWFR
jgi:hypothetical protein